MKKACLLAGAAMVLIGAAPAAGPVASYQMDAATASGFGAGMSGGRPDMAAMMMGRAGSNLAKTLSLRLHARGAPAGGTADHLIPAGVGMGPKLTLIGPETATPSRPVQGMPTEFQRPKGRILIYWGCGEHAGPGQPTVIDFATMKPGQMPPGMAAMGRMWGGGGGVAGPRDVEWPNRRETRAVPVNASLVGAHKIQSSFSPAIGYSLGAGQDFMPALGLREAGAMPSGAVPLNWTAAPTATGYGIMMIGAGQNGDMVMWSSSKSGTQMAPMDYLAPGEARRLVAAGTALSPATTQCILPAEVIAKSPTGAISMTGYGPYADFSDKPKNPTWTARARFKTTASLMLGMGDMMGAGGPAGPGTAQPPKKKKRFGIGDVLRGVSPVPLPR